MSSYQPLHAPDDPPVSVASLDVELHLARELLDKVADANIHDHTLMVRAAFGLDYRLRALLAAIAAERGDRS